MMDKKIYQEIIDEYDHVISETPNAYVSLRKVRWSETGDIKLDLRKYITRADGTEQMMKGCSFPEEAGHELAAVLTETGYGDTRTILNNIKDRGDFKVSMIRSLGDDDIEAVKRAFPDMEIPEPDEIDEEFYDIRKELAI
jgi:hypothetical protein